jgi:hypothetical protein
MDQKDYDHKKYHLCNSYSDDLEIKVVNAIRELLLRAVYTYYYDL